MLVIICGAGAVLAFPDVSDTHWAASQIKELSEKGVIVGYPDGTFQPDDNVTRYPTTTCQPPLATAPSLSRENG